MRFAILAFPRPVGPGGVACLNSLEPGAAGLKTMSVDRVAEGYAFPGERVVRLPRRLCRSLARSGTSVMLRETLMYGHARGYVPGGHVRCDGGDPEIRRAARRGSAP